MADGYYRMHRGWMDHPIFRGDRYSRAQAWEWLIGEASHRDGKYLKRGQLSHSIRHMAKEWGWDAKSVQRLLTRLEAATMIATDTATGQTRITICNYEKYQTDSAAPATPAATPPATDPPQTRHNRQGMKKEEEEELRSSTYAQNRGSFASWYAQYPRKRGKTAAEKSYAKAIKQVTPETLLAGVMRYAAWCDRTGQDPDYIPYPATWLNQGRWEDDLPEKQDERTAVDRAFDNIEARFAAADARRAEADAVDLEGAAGDRGEHSVSSGSIIPMYARRA